MTNYFENYRKSEVTNTRRVIPTTDENSRRNFFYVQEAGYLESLTPHESRRHNLNSYLFMVILAGRGTIQYDGTTCTVSAGDCIYIDCRNEYSHKSSADEPWQLLWIHFNGPHAAYYYDYFRERCHTVFSPADVTIATDIINRIIQLHEVPNADSPLIASQLITGLLTQSIIDGNTHKAGNNAPVTVKMSDVLNYINEHFTHKITLDELSQKFYISKYYLSRAFKKEYGMTIVQYILSKRISLAKERLRYSNSSIEDIAASCGIPDASYFNKVFVKLEGITASQYRQGWRGRHS